MDEPLDNMEQLSTSVIWDHMQTQPTIAQLSDKLIALDSVFSSDKDFFNKLGNRDVIVSAHMISKSDYGFLYLADLEEYARLDFIKNNINQLVDDDYEVTTRTYKTHTITELKDLDSYETLSISYVKNQLIASYHHQLVEKSLDEYELPQIGRDDQFLQVQNKVQDSDLLRVFVNHAYVDSYIRLYLQDTGEITSIFTKDLSHSGWSINEEDNKLLTAHGYSNGNTMMSSLLQALDDSGTGSLDATGLLPDDTAVYMSIGFDNFSTVHKNFYDLLKENNAETVAQYNSGKNRIERLLDINLERDVYSWIDDEVAFAKAESHKTTAQDGLAVLLKTKSTDRSAAKLLFIEDQIRRKTPVKFNQVTYRDHRISYLDIKGFFKLILGPLFEKLEKPYYTTIDEYVVFSNSPVTLRHYIDAYLDKKTLLQDEYYRTFLEEFSTSSNAFLYINNNLALDALEKDLTATSARELNDNRNFLAPFTQLGLELTAHQSYLESNLVIHYDASYDYETQQLLNLQRELPMDLVTLKKEELNKKTLFNISIFPTDFTARKYETYHVNGKTKTRVSLKSGQPHGIYKEYYFNGDLKMSGRYRKGKQSGSWKYFTREGKLFHKKRF